MNPVSQLARKARLAIGLGILKLTDDARSHQTIQVTLLKGEVRDGVNRYQNYGHTSNPLDGAEVVLVAVGGNRNNLAAIAVDDPRYRKKGLAKGEHALYHHEGDYILMKNGRIIEVVSGVKVKVTAPLVEVVAETKVTLTTPLTEFSGNVAIAGALSVTGNTTMQGNMTSQGTITGAHVKQGAIELGTHTHADPQGGTVGTPA